MKTEIPADILSGMDGMLEQLSNSHRIKSYNFLIGDPADACRPEYDDSGWNTCTEAVGYRRSQGTTWIRFRAELPETVTDIPVAGSAVRLSGMFSAPVDTYVNGELRFSENTWSDYKFPEIILTDSAVPGSVFQIASKLRLSDFCYFSSRYSVDLTIDRVEDCEFEIASFREELKYAAGFDEVRDILPEVFRILSASLSSGQGALALSEKIRLCREMLRPMEARAKKDTVHLIGHAHIDMDWFWSIEETRSLVRRDFSTMAEIMEEVPEFRFSQSQCAAYDMAETLYPSVFEKVKKCVEAGSWDVTASTWVEGDMNMSSGESIVRHILYSKKYLREKFAVEPAIMWCPDTFGHSGNVPQIAKKAGIDYYFFMRCGKQIQPVYCSDFMEYGAEKPIFWWQGIDGTRVLAYNMAYNSDMNTHSVLNISGKLRHRFGLSNSMFVYGTGDHGGGPTRRDIRRAQQIASFPTAPTVRFSTTRDFFSSVVKENSPCIPVEKGELNFVFDGCYTTHADIKRYNRLCENMLTGTETLAAAGKAFGLPCSTEAMEECWKSTLFNQFHDIFDGSGVKATYRYSSEIAEKALSELQAMSGGIIEKIGAQIKTTGKGIPVLLFNPTGWERSGAVMLSLEGPLNGCCGACGPEGGVLPSQLTAGGLFVSVQGIPPMGYRVIYLNRKKYEAPYIPIREDDDFCRAETRFYRVEIKKSSGEITSLYDKENDRYVVSREDSGWKLRNGVLNTLEIYYEAPSPMSAWTIGPTARTECLISGAKTAVREDGPLVKIITVEHRFGSSRISQDIILAEDSRRIDFASSADWNETGGEDREAPMLRVCFTPDVDNRDAAYEIPFGSITRPCRDMEVPALRWADISDEEYGFSLLNDCKYGHRVKGNSMELTLIRSGWEPDPRSDVGRHEFTYSILPHKGRWQDGGTANEADCLNRSIFTGVISGNACGSLPETACLVKVSGKNAVVSAFKCAEEGGALILRVYNPGADAAEAAVELGFPVRGVQETDLLERKTYAETETDGRKFGFRLGAFEIKTFRLVL